MFYRAATKRQLWNQPTKKSRKTVNINTTLCCIYRYTMYYTPSQVHEWLIKFVWLCCCCCCCCLSIYFFKSIFFLCCVPLMIIIWNKILDEYFMRALNSAPCNQKCALVFHPFAFIVVIISLLSSGPVAFISVRLPYTFSCSSFFFLCCDHFLCIFTL